MKKKCTCETQIVGGLCSSWCDTVRPDETPPETERSADDWPTRPSVYNPAGIFSIPYTFQPAQPAKDAKTELQKLIDAIAKGKAKLAPPKP